MPSNDLAAELERFEKDLAPLDEDDIAAGAGPDIEDEGEPIEEPKSEEPTGEPADETPVEEPESDAEPTDQPDAAPDKKPALTTLPDDTETFGDLAGKQVTAEEIIEAGLLTKLVTWGHQGRHMIQKGQKELAEAKTAASEAEKLRLLLEDRFKKEDAAAEQQTQPQISEKQFVEHLSQAYMPGLQKVAAEGGIEEDFIKEFPKAAVHLEHRFQSGAQLLQGLVQQIDELTQFVGMQKQQVAKTEAKSSFEGLLESVASESELFTGLRDPQGKVDFIQWVTDEASGLRITEKEIGDISQADVQSAYLLYLHQHPEALGEKKQPKRVENAHLAGGGTGKVPSRKTGNRLDEFVAFEKELEEARNQGFD